MISNVEVCNLFAGYPQHIMLLYLFSAGVLHYDNHQSAVSTVAPIAGPATSEVTAGSGTYWHATITLNYIHFLKMP